MGGAAIDLPGYRIGPVLRRGRGRVVFRAERNADGAAVAVETLDTEYPGLQQVAEIRREGAIVRQLEGVEGVLAVHAVEPHGSGNLALVTELFGHPLAERLAGAAGRGLPLADVLDLAAGIAHALDAIHSREIVHKAVTPEHILVDDTGGAVRLTGFGIASELTRERQAPPLSRRLEGPLPYLSPEQTGRMNRDLDYRSDYYSLGVTLFELLTGQRPFEADHPLEWVHSHISRLPPAPREVAPEVPEAVSAIVLKLLAKSPEDRYQSARGLLADLEHCREAIAAGRAIEAFEPGREDLVQRFLVPQNLYGRERELAELFDLFEAAVNGHSVLCLVHGYSGVGKSALVNELDRPLVRERGFLAQGKFDQFHQGEAYTALAAAFRGLVQQVLAEPEERLAGWRTALQTALGPNAQLVFDLVPELELILGEQPPVAELPPAEARNRLQIVLTSFIRAFATAEHPLVLFLDDLQWSDVPTLELLRRLVTSRDVGHLLLIGAYRSNEVGPGHPLRLTLDALQGAEAVREVALAPLDRDSVAHLVADALRTEPQRARGLSDLLYEKAQGNPFFTTELLKKLHEEGAIILAHETGRWEWDLDAARWSGLSSDVVAFMVDNLRQLPPVTQRVLQLAACIGGTFDLRTLSVIHERSPAETAGALLPALKHHTVVPLHAEYKLVGQATGTDGAAEELAALNPAYRFQHDRIQQAAYALIDAGRMQAVHYSVGRLMLQHAGDAGTEERLIDIVGHLNEGRGLINHAAERLELARLNLKAGVRARRSAAYEAAMDYLRVGWDLLPEAPWEREPDLAMALAAESQQCAYLTARSEEAEDWIERMLERARSDLERTEILATQTRQYATLGRMEDSIESAIRGLALLGVELTTDPDAEAIAEERRRVDANLGRRQVADLVEAPTVEDEPTLVAMRLLMEIFPAAFLSGSGNLFPYLVLKAVNLSLRHGNCPESAFAYVAYGMLLCGELDDPALGYQYGRVGLAINERFDDLSLRARVIYVYAMFTHHWSNHWSTLTPWFRKGIEAGYQSGDLLYLAYSAQDCVIWDPTLDLETAAARHAENLEIVRECAYQDSLDSATLFLQLQRNLQGLTDEPGSLSDDGFDERRCLEGMRERQFMTGIANYHIYKAEACFQHGLYERALGHVREQDRLIKSAMSLPQLVRFYIVAFLTRASVFPDLSPVERQTIRERLEQDLGQMRRWADNCPDNFRHLQHLMEAELERLDGAGEAVLERFEAAIEAARASGFLRDEAVACERTARHLLRLGRRRAAEGYLRAAYHIYGRWGARRKVALLEEEFPVLRELGVGGADPTGSVETAGGLDGGDLDLASVMKASRAISGEIVLDRLLQTTMEILLENAGGQWGCLVVRRDGELAIEALVAGEEGGPADGDGMPPHTLIADGGGRRVGLPVTLVSHVLRTGDPVVLHDAANTGTFTEDPYMVRRAPRSVLCVPLRRERFEGVVYMENALATGVFTEARVEVIRLLAAQAAVAVENAQLYEQVQDYSRTLEEKVAERTDRLEQLNRELQSLADRDGLTGVANRRRGDAYLQEAWDHLRREGNPLSVIMFDVDDFKAYNDNYGHQAGDDALVAVAGAARAQIHRASDLVARYGGEEFMVILPDTDEQGAWTVAAHLCEAVHALAIPHAHSSVSGCVTVSVGVATARPARSGTPEELVRHADAALYAAKAAGRNRVRGAAGLEGVSGVGGG